MPTYTITGFANSSVGWSANQIDAAGPASVSGDGLAIEVVDDDLILDDESAGAGQTVDASSQVLGNSFGVVASGQVVQSVYKWTVTNTTTGEVGTGYLLRIYTGTNPASPGGQDGEYYQVFTIAVHDGDVLTYGSGNFIGQVPYADIHSANVIDGTPGDDGLNGTPGDDIINGFAGNDVEVGRAGNDTLNGDDDHDMLRGGDGNDTLNGGNGDDYLRGGEGDDIVDGGPGYDRAAFTVAVDNPAGGESGVQTGATVDLNLQGVAQDTGHGMDTLTGIEHVSGTVYDDTLIGDGGDNWLWGEGGNDILSGNGGNDLIETGPGNSVLDGGADVDTATFLGNDDFASGVNVSLGLQGSAQTVAAGSDMTLINFENLSGSLHDDTLTGDTANNVLAGNSGNDSLSGGSGDDTLYGDGSIQVDTHGTGLSGPITTFADVGLSFGTADGDDLLEGGAGNDTLDGGGGGDTASYEHNGGPVDLNLQFGFADEYAADGVTYLTTDTLISIENAIGSAFDDALVGDSGDNLLQGLGGNDTILGQAGNDTVIGGDGSDIMRGDTTTSVGNDVMIGGDGDDHMRGGAGVDSFDGGSDDGGQSIYGGFGDRISFFEVAATQGVVADLRTGVISNDGFGNVESMTGIESLGGDTAFVDTFYGNDERNTLLGGLGDNLYGFGGDDQFSLGAAAGVVEGGDGTDTLAVNTIGGWLTPDTNSDGIAETVGAATEGWFIDLLGGFMVDGYGNFGNVTEIENVEGSDLADTVRGDDGNNVITGNGGDDFLIGNGGDDTVIGGDGNDNLRGDSQVYTGGPFGDDSLYGGAGNDLMRGSAGVDFFDGGTDTGDDPATGYGDRISFYEPAATQGVVADLRTGIISNDGFGNVELMVNVESLGADTAFVDTLYGNDGRNFLWGGRGDFLYGFGGDDLMNLSLAGNVDGGDGVDVLTLQNIDNALLPDTDSDGIAEESGPAPGGYYVNLADGIVFDGFGNSGTVVNVENVNGSDLGDILMGDDNANVLNGNDGDDTLEGRGGDDTLDGGSGSDTASYAGSTGPVEVDLGAGLAFEYASDGITFVSMDTMANIENATGSEFGDSLFGSVDDNVIQGLGGADLIAGQQGDDILDGGDGFDTAWYGGASGAVTVDLSTGMASGADGNDTLTGIESVTGSNFDDLLIGDSGANSLTGRNGNDTLIGGDGDDFLRGGAGNDVMDGGSGFDRVSHYGTNITNGVTVDLRIAGAQDTGHGWDTYIGIEALSGSRYDDTLIGNDDDNWFVAADGNDTLVGNGGNDLLTVADGELGPASTNHSLDGGDGSDTVDLSWIALGTAGATLSLDLQGAAQDSGHGLLTLNNIENLSGTTHDDALTGDGNSNTLSGNAGNDALAGGDGDDSLYGDGAMIADTRAGNGGSGPITFFADVTDFDPSLVAGDDLLEGGAGNDQIDGGGGNDTASYEHNQGGVEAFLGNSGFGAVDEYAADGVSLLSTDFLQNIENLMGSAFGDFLQGNAGANVLSGLGGNDTILGMGGDDVVDGGDGDDTLRGDNGANTVTGNDTLHGGDGNDYLNGGFGDDVIDGGAGYDRATFYQGSTTGVHVDLNLQGVAQDTGQGNDTLTNIENVSGTAYGDTLIGDGGDNWLWGSTAIDEFGVSTGANDDTIDGGGGNDLLTVATGNHSLTGGSGTDTVNYTENGLVPDSAITVSLELQGAGQDTGAGIWTLNGIENLSGGTGNDNLTGDGNDNVLAGNIGNDTLVGGEGNDALYGDGAIQIDYDGGPGTSGPIALFADVTSVDPSLVDGDDTLEGGAGSDTLNGGGGSDTASYEHNAGSVDVNLQFGFADEYTPDFIDYLTSDTLVSIENVTGSAFADSIVGDGGSNVLNGLGGNDTIQGQGGDDTLYGGDGDDFLLGDAGENSLTVSGNDVMYGGNGNDGLRGGLGNDQLYGGDNNDLLRGNGGVDYYDGGADDGEGFNGIGDRVSFFDRRATQGAVADLRTGIVSNDGYGNVETMVGIESLGADTAFVDTFYGNDARNFIGGSRGDNLYGFGGDDLFQTGAAAAVIDGGSGIDTLGLDSSGGWLTPDSNADGLAEIAAAASAGWTVNLGAGTMVDGYGNAGTITGIENVNGSALGDTLTGDSNANMLNGGDGNDVLNGRGGDDTLDGGNGIDTASYANAAGSVSVDLGAGAASGADGNDVLIGIENATGGAFDDLIFGNGLGNVLSGGDGHDALRGFGGNDTLLGGNGDDFLNGNVGDDTIDGGAGWDRATFASGAVAGVTVDLNLQGTAQNTGQGMDTLTNIEHVSGTAFNDTLIGDGGDNWIWGQGGTDVLTGNGGNDLIQSGAAGNLTASGGSGTDTLSVNDNGVGSAGVTVSLALQGGAQATGIGTYTLTGFENLSGSSGNDTLTGDGSANLLAGDEGNDTLVGGAGNDTLYGDGQVVTDSHGVGTSGPITTFADVGLVGGVSGNDTLEGGLGNDTLNGGGGTDTASYANASGGVSVDLAAGTSAGADGNDTLIAIENVTGSAFGDQLSGNSGDNLLSGGGGNDTLNGRAGNDTLVGGAGTDTASYANASGGVTVSLTDGTASGADGSDTLATIENVSGSAFADTLTGDSNANVLNGGNGDDVLNGRAGNDTLIGGTGSDTASYANATGGVSVNLGTGSATGADGTDTLTSIENATGSSFADTLRGDANANRLSGGGGNDAIVAGAGDDWLYGGQGNDTMTGNQGADRYVIETASGTDHVTDFAAGIDKVAFSGIAGVDDFGDLTITKSGNNTVITWGTGDSLILDGVKPTQLSAGDFEFSAAASFAAAEQIVSKTALNGGAYDHAMFDAASPSFEIDFDNHGAAHLAVTDII